MNAMRRHRRIVALVLFAVLGLVAAGCSGGGGSTSEDATAPPVGTPTGSGDRPVQFEGAGKVKLFGTFSMPATSSGGNVPAVLILPTAGTGDRSGLIGPTGVADPFGRDLSEAFTDAGLATYRYDQRGTGESHIEPEVRLTVDDLVADARAALDLLAERRETAGRDLSVVAYEEGGLIALRLAAADNRVKRLVLVSTPGRSLTDVRAAQLQARFGPESAEALRSVVTGLLAPAPSRHSTSCAPSCDRSSRPKRPASWPTCTGWTRPPRRPGSGPRP